MIIEISHEIQRVSLQISDAGEMFRLIESNRAGLGQYLSWVDRIIDVTSTEAFIDERVNSSYSGAQWFKVISQGILCGMFGIKSISGGGSIAEVGYFLAGEVQGRGIIATILVTMSRYFEAEIGVRVFEFRCLDANKRSINTALRAGAVLTQVIPNFMKLNGTIHNLNVYQVNI